MANIADANVHIEAKHCANEVQAWLKAVDRDAYYNVCDDHEGTVREDWGDNSKEFNGAADGRWTYQTNIESALSPDKEKRTTWCSHDEAEQAYQALMQKLADDHEAEVVVEYDEAECGFEFVGEGVVRINYDPDQKKVVTETEYACEDLTVGTLIDHGFVDTVEEAKEYMGMEEE